MSSLSCSTRCTVLNNTLVGILFRTFLVVVQPLRAGFARARSICSNNFQGISTLDSLFFSVLRFRHPLPSFGNVR